MIQAVSVPPINLWNIGSALYLLLKYPLLAGTERGEAVAQGSVLLYNQELVANSAANVNAHHH
jgi:hypothetical protein